MEIGCTVYFHVGLVSLKPQQRHPDYLQAELALKSPQLNNQLPFDDAIIDAPLRNLRRHFQTVLKQIE